LQFKRYSFFEKGFAYFIEYRKENNTRVEFLFGPSDWNIEMIIYTSRGKFAFKDVLNITGVKNWVNSNRYTNSPTLYLLDSYIVNKIFDIDNFKFCALGMQWI